MSDPQTLRDLRLDKLRRLQKLAAEKEKRVAEEMRQIDVFAKVGYEPFERQRIFHEATEHAVLYGGSLGGGKSRALVAEAVKACVRHPGIRVGAFRRSYGELKESLIAELAQLGFAEELGAKWNGSDFELRFPNGSLVMFRYAENLVDATRRQGGQYQLLIFDEMTLTNPDVIGFLESRLRSGRADIPVIGVRASANPGGPGHGYVRNRFIDPTNYGQRVILDPNSGQTTRFIPSSMKDNPHLDAGYINRLNALPEELRRAFRDGDWAVFSGQMFRNLARERHVCDPITIPSTWPRYNGIDWGFAAPWAVLWGALDEDGRVWIYRELYARQVGEAEQARRILEAEKGEPQIVARYADDALWATRGDARPISDVYSDNGVYLTPAGKGGRVSGWQRVRSYLDEAPACPMHRAKGWETCPKLHMFPQVENLFMELRDLPHAQKGDPEDADTNAPDHAADALRYMLLNLGTGPSFPILTEVPTSTLVPDVPGGGMFTIRHDSSEAPINADPMFIAPEYDEKAWQVKY